jgi:hypothetical protein
MSLNRVEQFLFDYLQSHREEGQHWREKVLSHTRSVADHHEAAQRLEFDLWSYYCERARSSRDFLGHPAQDLRRTSMKNLADHLVRLWAPPPRRSERPPLN